MAVNGTGGVGGYLKNNAEIANLKRKIAYEDERIVEVFADIGKKYYKNPNDDPAIFRQLCEDIDSRRRRIRRMMYELNNLRGYRLCPKCDAEVSGKFQFCGVCGARLPSVSDDDFIADLDEGKDYYSEASDEIYEANTRI
ncbi:MAG: zinc ribbon domain-containing protein [Oscillospiraceae bacterium]|jgi:hypothetical protein|nr:zinc ribbon domain-containing protein [Oscillospiraceae bacterium]